MRKRILAAAGVLAVAFVLGMTALWDYAHTRGNEPEFVFFYAENQAEDYPTVLGAKRFAELVEERTGGVSGFWCRRRALWERKTT